jgi:putative peptidoglycan lipid II flippase
VWGALAGSAVGLLAGTMGRLYSSASFALRDTRTPMRYATVRVTLAAILGATAALTLPRALGIDARWGVAIVTASSGVAAWVEYFLLRGYIHGRIGEVRLPAGLALRLWGCAAAAATVAVLLARATAALHPIVTGVFVAGTFGLVYLGLTRVLGADRARRA